MQESVSAVVGRVRAREEESKKKRGPYPRRRRVWPLARTHLPAHWRSVGPIAAGIGAPRGGYTPTQAQKGYCWDGYGQSGPDYATQDGIQIATVRDMLRRLGHP